MASNIQYCSIINTANTNRTSNIYQSNGSCEGICFAKYSFAIVQGDGCWCSSVVPLNTTEISKCDEPCPGLATDACGGNGLFGYIPLSVAPTLNVVSTPVMTSSSSSRTSGATGAKISTPSQHLKLSRISTIAKVGIGVGCSFLLVATTVGVLFLFWRQRGRKNKTGQVPAGKLRSSYPAHQDRGSDVLAPNIEDHAGISSMRDLSPRIDSFIYSLEHQYQARDPQHRAQNTTQPAQQDHRARANHFAPSIYELPANRPLSPQDIAFPTSSSIYSLESNDQPPRYPRDTSAYPAEQYSKEDLVPPSIYDHPAKQTLSPLSPLSSRDLISNFGTPTSPPQYHIRAQPRSYPFSPQSLHQTFDPSRQDATAFNERDGFSLITSYIELPDELSTNRFRPAPRRQ